MAKHLSAKQKANQLLALKRKLKTNQSKLKKAQAKHTQSVTTLKKAQAKLTKSEKLASTLNLKASTLQATNDNYKALVQQLKDEIASLELVVKQLKLNIEASKQCEGANDSLVRHLREQHTRSLRANAKLCNELNSWKMQTKK